MDGMQLIFPQEICYPNDFFPLIITNDPQLSKHKGSSLALL